MGVNILIQVLEIFTSKNLATKKQTTNNNKQITYYDNK